MTVYRIRFLILLFLIIPGCTLLPKPIFAQQPAIDSLTCLLNTSLNDSARISVLTGLSDLIVHQDLKRAVAYAEMAVELGRLNSSAKILAPAMLNSGRIYFRAGLMDQAVQRFAQYLEMMRDNGSKREIANAIFNLGTVRITLQDFEQAEELINKAVELLNENAEEKNVPIPVFDLIQINNNLGIIAQNKGDLQKAMSYFNTAIDSARNHPELIHSLAMVLACRGRILTDQHENAVAKNDLSEVLQISEKIQSLSYKSVALLLLGQIADQEGNSQESIQFFKQAYLLALELGGYDMIQNTAKQLSVSFQKIGVADSSLKYLTISNEFSEKVQRKKAVEEITRAEVSELFKSKEKAAYKKHLLEVVILYLIITFTLLAGLMFFWYLRRRIIKIRRINDKLESASDRLVSEKTLLENDLKVKNAELEEKVMYHIHQKNNIDSLYHKVLEYKGTDSADHKRIFNDILTKLGKAKDDSLWNEFEIRFRQAHTGFAENLQKLCPNLTPNERRLCAFLHLNMTTKEISNITGQSTISIEMSRTRLRKKLNITNTGKSLVEVLASL